jgi:flavin reductase (DIM6/NTAB) family NADH-FMN oxidoreductase RutF
MAFADLTGQINPPLYIVTADDGVDRSGCVVGFATQCSIYPPRFLVCLSVLNHTTRLARRAPALAVHILGVDEHALAAHFGALSGDETDKLAGVRWHRGALGTPVLDAAAGVFEGRVLERLELGDHIGHLLAPDGETGVDEEAASDQLRLRDVPDVRPAHPPAEILTVRDAGETRSPAPRAGARSGGRG